MKIFISKWDVHCIQDSNKLVYHGFYSPFGVQLHTWNEKKTNQALLSAGYWQEVGTYDLGLGIDRNSCLLGKNVKLLRPTDYMLFCYVMKRNTVRLGNSILRFDPYLGEKFQQKYFYYTWCNVYLSRPSN